MNLKALIFDVDGTLADTEEAHRCAFNQAFHAHGLDWHWSPPKYAELLRTTGGKERISAHIESLALAPEAYRDMSARVASLHETKTDNYTRMIVAGTVPLRDGVARLLDEASASGVRLAIASTTTLKNIEALLRTHLGEYALERFSVIAGGDQVARKKPAPDVYQYVLRALGLSGAECVAIEDSENGVKSAKAAGLFTVVTPTYWTRQENLAEADLIVPSLEEARLGIREIDQLLSEARAFG